MNRYQYTSGKENFHLKVRMFMHVMFEAQEKAFHKEMEQMLGSIKCEYVGDNGSLLELKYEQA